MKTQASVWIKGALKYGLGIGLLIYILIKYWSPQGKNPGIQGMLEQTPNFLTLIGLACLVIGCTAFQFTRWYMLVRALDLPFTLRLAFKLGLVGAYWNAFAPGSVGGDLVKGYYIAHGQPGRRAAAVATVVADRLVGLFGLIWLSAACGIAFWAAGNVLIAENDYLKFIIRVCASLAVTTVVGWIVMGLLPTSRADKIAARLALFPGRILRAFAWGLGKVLPARLGERIARSAASVSVKIGDVLAELWYSVWTYRQRPRVIYLAVVLTAVVHIGFVMMFHLAVRVYPAPDPASFPEHLVVTPIGYIAQAFFPAPGGVGGGEAIFGYLYTLLNRPEETGVWGRFTLRVNEWGIGIVGLFVFLRMRSELRVVEEELEEAPLHPGEEIRNDRPHADELKEATVAGTATVGQTEQHQEAIS